MEFFRSKWFCIGGDFILKLPSLSYDIGDYALKSQESDLLQQN
jgi:hypothetical protein